MKYLLLFLFLPINLYGQDRVRVELKPLTDSVWIHTSYKLYDDANVPSNGLIIRTSVGIILIDTPWDDSLTTELIQLINEKFHQPYILAFITHAHADRIGGIQTLQQNGIKTITMPLCYQKARESGYEISELFTTTDTTLTIGKTQVEFFYPGAGHTIDNNVVWLPNNKILFGGCLVKSESAMNLGNIADADMHQWPQTISLIQKKYSEVRIVVPGHGDWGSS